MFWFFKNKNVWLLPLVVLNQMCAPPSLRDLPCSSRCRFLLVILLLLLLLIIINVFTVYFRLLWLARGTSKVETWAVTEEKRGAARKKEGRRSSGRKTWWESAIVLLDFSRRSTRKGKRNSVKSRRFFVRLRESVVGFFGAKSCSVLVYISLQSYVVYLWVAVNLFGHFISSATLWTRASLK